MRSSGDAGIIAARNIDGGARKTPAPIAIEGESGSRGFICRLTVEGAAVAAELEPQNVTDH